MPNHRDVALRLSYATAAYNLLEGLVSVVFAVLADSPALLGFGIDSFVESLSGLVMIWHFSHANQDEAREHTAVRLIGVSLMILGAYVTYQAVTALYYVELPKRSFLGLIIALLSIVVMPILYVMKRRTAKALESRSLAADAQQTLACIMLSLALLLGTGLHFTIGFWQADPLAGLFIAAYLLREGYKAWSDQELCC